MTPKITSKNWKKSFNKRFDNLYLVESWNYEECKCGKYPCECKKIVIDFISQVLQAQAKDLAGEEKEECVSNKKGKYDFEASRENIIRNFERQEVIERGKLWK